MYLYFMQYYIQCQNCKFLALFIIAQIDKIPFEPNSLMMFSLKLFRP